MIIKEKQNIFEEQVLKNDQIDQEILTENITKEIDAIDPKDEKIEKLESEISNIKKCERDNLLRLKAEMENIKRRSRQDIEKAHKFALEHFFIELLPVIDNLERTIDTSSTHNNEFVNTIEEGIKLTLQSLLDAVRKFGLSVINDSNVPFNPDIHQAITVLESDEHENNQVVKIMQNGYMLNGRLVRPATVVVSKSKN